MKKKQVSSEVLRVEFNLSLKEIEELKLYCHEENRDIFEDIRANLCMVYMSNRLKKTIYFWQGKKVPKSLYKRYEDRYLRMISD